MFFLVSHKYKFLMGWSAKCGCSSVKHWYLDVHGVDKSRLGVPVYKAIGYANTEYTRLDWNNSGLYRDYRKYAVVRNPYSRVVSGFVNKYIIENARLINFCSCLRKTRTLGKSTHITSPPSSQKLIAVLNELDLNLIL
jgi:Sulfotransferase family